MNEEVKKEWIDRLRSGRYNQTSGKLRREGGFCCLGVLCEIARDKEIVTLEGDEIYSRYVTLNNRIDAEVAVPPESVVSFSDLGSQNPNIYFTPEEYQVLVDRGVSPEAFYASAQGGSINYITNLATLNDNGATFSLVAEVIEQKL